MARDGRCLALTQEDVSSTPRYHLVVNWFEELTRRVPVTRGEVVYGNDGVPADYEQLEIVNQLVFSSERRLGNDAGLPRRDWLRHQVYGTKRARGSRR